eukprot:g3401.t1
MRHDFVRANGEAAAPLQLAIAVGSTADGEDGSGASGASGGGGGGAMPAAGLWRPRAWQFHLQFDPAQDAHCPHAWQQLSAAAAVDGSAPELGRYTPAAGAAVPAWRLGALLATSPLLGGEGTADAVGADAIPWVCGGGALECALLLRILTGTSDGRAPPLPATDDAFAAALRERIPRLLDLAVLTRAREEATGRGHAGGPRQRGGGRGGDDGSQGRAGKWKGMWDGGGGLRGGGIGVEGLRALAWARTFDSVGDSVGDGPDARVAATLATALPPQGAGATAVLSAVAYAELQHGLSQASVAAAEGRLFGHCAPALEDLTWRASHCGTDFALTSVSGALKKSAKQGRKQ